jgi:hypothetical protein
MRTRVNLIDRAYKNNLLLFFDYASRFSQKGAGYDIEIKLFIAHYTAITNQIFPFLKAYVIFLS